MIGPRVSRSWAAVRWVFLRSKVTPPPGLNKLTPGTAGVQGHRRALTGGSVVGRPALCPGDLAPLPKHFGTVARMGMPGSADRLARCRSGGVSTSRWRRLPEAALRYRTSSNVTGQEEIR